MTGYDGYPFWSHELPKSLTSGSGLRLRIPRFILADPLEFELASVLLANHKSIRKRASPKTRARLGGMKFDLGVFIWLARTRAAILSENKP